MGSFRDRISKPNRLLLLVYVLCFLGFVFNRSHSGQPEQLDNAGKQPSLSTVKTNPKVCALFFVYSGVKRYEDEVVASITRLKSLNPDVFTILVTDNPALSSEAVIDRLELMKEGRLQRFTRSFNRAIGRSEWLTRVEYISTLHSWASDCDITISLDSHVTVCSRNMYARMQKLYHREDFHIGTNVEHVPGFAVAFEYDRSYGKRLHPHNFAIVFKKSLTSARVFQGWYHRMTSWKGRLIGIFNSDDQRPLMFELQAQNTPLSRLPESLAYAEKSVDKGKFGMLPRFTFAFDGNVTLVHSYDKNALPSGFSNICDFVNSDRRPRMVLRSSTSKQSKYQLAFSVAQCLSVLNDYEPRMCTDRALSFGLRKPFPSNGID